MIDQSLILDGTISGTGVPTGVAITNSRVSTNVIDWLTGRDMGAAALLGIHVDVTTAFSGATSLQIDFEVCDTVGGTYLALDYSPVIPVAQLIAGAPIFRNGVPLNQVLNATAGILKTPGRFVRLNYTVAGGPFTAGAVFSYLSAREDRNQFFTYPNNYTAQTVL